MTEIKSPKLRSATTLKEVMGAYYLEAKNAAHNNLKVAWVTSGAPVEFLYAFDVIPLYPEQHGAMCGAAKMAVELCEVAESRGYSQDLCSYFRCDVGQAITGNSPIMGLPRPDFLLCCNNVCSTVTKWYEIQARYFDVPNIMIDTPFQQGDIEPEAIEYVIKQFKEMIVTLEGLTGVKFSEEKFFEVLKLADEAVALWGEALDCCCHRPSPLSAFDTFIHMAPIVTLRGTQKCVEYYRELRDELKERIAGGIAAVPGERYRLLWDNIPIWFRMKGLSEKFAELGACLVGATYTDSWRRVGQTFMVDDPYPILAETYLAPYINRGFNVRVNIIAELVERYDVDDPARPTAWASMTSGTQWPSSPASPGW